MHYRKFFSTLALAVGSATSLGLVLSLPTTFTVEQARADTTTSTVVTPTKSTTLETLDTTSTEPIATVVPPTEKPLQKKLSTTTPPTTRSAVASTTNTKKTTPVPPVAKIATGAVFTVPFFSQLTDVTAPAWKKVACGITSLAMLIEYYHPHKLTSVDDLLHEGIAAGAYNDAVGWSYSGLITVAKKYGLDGSTHDYRNSSMEAAFTALTADVRKGPVMASVHYTFKSSNPIPHLVIIRGIKNGQVYYNDPAASTGGGNISVAQFKEGWKKRYIEFYKVN